MHTSFMNYLEERLYQWAYWYSHGNDNGLGYPSCSTEYRLMTEGIVVKVSVPPPLASNRPAEEIEELVKQMAEFNYLMAQALRCHYFISGTLRSKCKHLKISHTHFKHCVDMGHHWLAGRLSHRRKNHLFYNDYDQ